MGKDLNINVNDDVGLKDAVNPADEVKFLIRIKAVNGAVKEEDLDALVAHVRGIIEKQGWKFIPKQQG